MKSNNIIKLTESQLHQIIKESVETIIAENGYNWEDYALDDDGTWQTNLCNQLNHKNSRGYGKKQVKPKEDEIRKKQHAKDKEQGQRLKAFGRKAKKGWGFNVDDEPGWKPISAERKYYAQRDKQERHEKLQQLKNKRYNKQ